jgi:hypothetical protein
MKCPPNEKLLAELRGIRASLNRISDLLERGAAADAVQAADSPTPQTAFEVAREFQNFPARSCELAQTFLAEALKFPGVEVRRHKRSIIFVPRFVRIDYLLSGRAPVHGFAVSFFGSIDEFDDPRHLLKAGPKSFVRIRITSERDLDYCVKFLPTAYELRVGNREVER